MKTCNNYNPSKSGVLYTPYPLSIYGINFSPLNTTDSDTDHIIKTLKPKTHVQGQGPRSSQAPWSLQPIPVQVISTHHQITQ